MAGTRTRFVADAMLGSLSRKLRAFGFDTIYYRQGADSGILGLAHSEGRVLLTSDKALFAVASSRGMTAILVVGRTDGKRIASLLRSAKAAGIPLVRGPPLCSICDGALVAVQREEATKSVPPSVLRRHRTIFRCMECGHYYWRGGHWKKLSNLERPFDHRK